MKREAYNQEVEKLFTDYNLFISQKNKRNIDNYNRVFYRYKNPVVTSKHIPPYWKYDLNHDNNPFLLERLGINAAFNAGAILHENKIYLMLRIEGNDRKSFFGLAYSENGIDNFKFHEKPIIIPQTSEPDTNVYDMRLVKHEDGYFYGVFCTERKDPQGDISSAIAQAGIIKSKDLVNWERLSDLKTRSPQQRNVVLHPEFVNGKYAFYTRPMDGFIDTGSQSGIGFGLSDSIENAKIENEIIIDERIYHTIKESKNGLGPAPIKTKDGWLQLAHGVRNTAAGLRYVLYLFMTDLEKPWIRTYAPGGYFIAPKDEERLGDVSNVTFSNGWVLMEDGTVLIYYASSDTRMHVAESTIDILTDYVKNTPQDALISSECVNQRITLIDKNLDILKKLNLEKYV